LIFFCYGGGGFFEVCEPGFEVFDVTFFAFAEGALTERCVRWKLLRSGRKIGEER